MNGFISKFFMVFAVSGLMNACGFPEKIKLAQTDAGLKVRETSVVCAAGESRVKDAISGKYVCQKAMECVKPNVLSADGLSCDAPSCPAGQVFDTASNVCIEPIKCVLPNVLNDKTNSCEDFQVTVSGKSSAIVGTDLKLTAVANSAAAQVKWQSCSKVKPVAADCVDLAGDLVAMGTYHNVGLDKKDGLTFKVLAGHQYFRLKARILNTNPEVSGVFPKNDDGVVSIRGGYNSAEVDARVEVSIVCAPKGIHKSGSKYYPSFEIKPQSLQLLEGRHDSKLVLRTDNLQVTTMPCKKSDCSGTSGQVKGLDLDLTSEVAFPVARDLFNAPDFPLNRNHLSSFEMTLHSTVANFEVNVVNANTNPITLETHPSANYTTTHDLLILKMKHSATQQTAVADVSTLNIGGVLHKAMCSFDVVHPAAE